jgi:transposase
MRTRACFNANEARFASIVRGRANGADGLSEKIDKRIHAVHRSCEESRPLEEIPGIGPIVATALDGEINDWKAFRSGRSLAAWIGLVRKQHSTGGKFRLGGISKQGNRYLRWLLVAGAYGRHPICTPTARSGSGLHVSWSVEQSRSLP